MEKQEVFIEAIDVVSYGADLDNHMVVFQFEGFRSGAENAEDIFIDLPLHQDFYEAMKSYCSYYEGFMLQKFAEK